jgi:hypothetical protein
MKSGERMKIASGVWLWIVVTVRAVGASNERGHAQD